MTRSGSAYSVPRDANRVPFLLAASTADGITPVVLEADPTTHLLQTTGGGAVTNAGTFAVQNTAATPAGTNLIGKVGIDQTTPGTTNGVVIGDGTNNGSVVAGDTGFNGMAIAGATKQYSFTTSTPGVQTIGPYNTMGYSWIEINYTSVGTGLALTGQYAPTSGGVYVSINSFGATTAVTNGALGTTVNTTNYGFVKGNFFQIAVSALTSGTFSGTVTLRTFPATGTSVNALQQGTWTVGSNSATGSAVPANAFYMGIQGSSSLAGASAPSYNGDGISGNTLLSVASYLKNGAQFDSQYTPKIFIPLSAVSIATETTIWTPTSGKKFRIMGYALSLGTVGTAVTIKDNTAGTTILVIPANTIGVVELSPAMGNGILSAAANNVLTATGVATQTLTGYVYGVEV